MTYIPGNHDDRVRDFCGVHFGGVVVARDAIHQTADGRRFLVSARRRVRRGRAAGAVARRSLGIWPIEPSLRLNTVFNACAGDLGLGYWSLARPS